MTLLKNDYFYHWIMSLMSNVYITHMIYIGCLKLISFRKLLILNSVCWSLELHTFLLYIRRWNERIGEERKRKEYLVNWQLYSYVFIFWNFLSTSNLLPHSVIRGFKHTGLIYTHLYKHISFMCIHTYVHKWNISIHSTHCLSVFVGHLLELWVGVWMWEVVCGLSRVWRRKQSSRLYHLSFLSF